MRVRNGNGLTGSSEACLCPKASRSQPSRREPASEDSHSWKVRAVSYLRSQHRRGWRQRLFWALQACITTARSSVGSRSRTRCMPKAGRSSSNFYHAGRQSNSQLQPGGGAPVGPSEVLHGGVDGDDRRHAVHSLVGHGVAVGLTIFLSRGCLPQRGIAARHILALQLATLVSEALQR